MKQLWNISILNKLNLFCKTLNSPTKFEFNVFDAVIKAKLVHGLDAIQLS